MSGRTMDWKQVTDNELIAECLRRQLANGRLAAEQPFLINGIQHHAGVYALSFLGTSKRSD